MNPPCNHSSATNIAHFCPNCGEKLWCGEQININNTSSILALSEQIIMALLILIFILTQL